MREKREFRIKQLISEKERVKGKWKVKCLVKSIVEENTRNNTNSIGCDDYCTFNISRNNNKLGV